MPVITTNWKIEDYEYLHSFSLENIEQCVPKILHKGVELKRPEKVYKFYNDSDNSIDSLLNSYFYLAHPNKFNDPFDCLVNREPQFSNNKLFKKHRENIGVCCFSLIKDNPLMWGHYTNNYNGFCLKFDSESLKIRDKIAIRCQTTYLNEYIPSFQNESFKNVIEELGDNFNEIKKDLIHNSLQILFEYSVKHYDWKYENEFRAISLNTNLFNRKCNFDKKHLEEIYIGYKMKNDNPNFYEILKHVIKTKYPHIKVFEVVPHTHRIKLKFNEISI